MPDEERTVCSAGDSPAPLNPGEALVSAPDAGRLLRDVSARVSVMVRRTDKPSSAPDDEETA